MDVWKKIFHIAELLGKDKNEYVWMEAKKYIDANENTAIITLHNEKIVQNTVIKNGTGTRKKDRIWQSSIGIWYHF